MLALAGLVLMFECRQHGRGVIPRGDIVGVSPERAGRLAVGPTRRVEKARDGSRQIAEPGKVRVGAGLAHQAGAEHDDIGLDFCERLVVKAPFAHGFGRKGLGHHVCPAHQIKNDLTRLRLGQVQGHRQFAGIHIIVQTGIVRAGLLVLKRPDHADRVKAGGGFNPHNGRSVVGQNTRRAGAGHGPHEIEHLDSGQGLIAFTAGLLSFCHDYPLLIESRLDDPLAV